MPRRGAAKKPRPGPGSEDLRRARAGEGLTHLLRPQGEDRAQLPADPHRLPQPAQPTPAGVVGDQIRHFDAARDRGEPVLVVPQAVGTAALFVHEVLALPDVGNLGQPEGTEFGDTIDKTDFKTLLIVAGSMATYPLLIERAGFIVASTVAFFGVSSAFGAKNALKNLAISILFSAIVYFSFTRGLNVNLPSGILGGI